MATKTARLINHRQIAKLFGIEPRTWRRWYNEGKVPIPQQMIGTMLFYEKSVIDYRLNTGKWPAGVKFLNESSEGQISLPSDDAIQMEPDARSAHSS